MSEKTTIGLVLRLAKWALSLAVLVSAIRLVVTHPPEALQGPDPSPPSSIEGLESALTENAINPYRWLEMAEGYEQAGDLEKARVSFRRAEQLGPNLPPVWIRVAGFHFRMGETREGLLAGAHAQGISESSDAFLFQYYDRFVRDTPLVIQAIAADRRALSAFLRHLMAAGKPEDASVVWAALRQQQFATRELGIAYVEFLLAQRRYDEAEKVWVQETRPETRGGYPAHNRVYNGGFEMEPSGCRLDWKIGKSETVEVDRDASVAREGKFSLRVRFPGTENVSFQQVTQTVIAASGNYRLSAWLKTEGITTDQGVRFCIQDAESNQRLSFETDPIRGTNDWMEVAGYFTVPPQTNLLNLSICRLPSLRFDSKVSGTVWIDGVTLARSSPAPGH